MVDILTSGTNTKKLDLVNSNYNESESWLVSSKYSKEWETWNNLYRNISKSKPEKFKWMSNRFVPLTFSKVETAYSNLMGLIFSVNPPFDVRPRERNDEHQAMLIKRLLSFQFEESNVYYEFSQFLKSLCIYGTSIGKVIWDKKYDMRTEWVDQYQPIISMFGMQVGKKFMGTHPQETQYLSFDGPKFFNCNLSDIFPEPNIIDIQDGWVIHRTYRDRDYLIKCYEEGIYNAEVLKITDEDGTEHKKSMDVQQVAMGRLSNVSITRPKGSSKIELLERWGIDEDPNDGKLKPRLLTVACGKYLIRNTNNPFWHGKNPFIKGTYIPVINEFYGIGLPEICESMQRLLNESVNQRIDNISLALNRIILYKKNSGITFDNLRSEPGWRVGTNEDIHNSIKYIDTPIYTRDSFMQTNEIERWLQEATSVTKLTLGMQGKDVNDTATGMAILQRASGDKFTTLAKIIENSAFRELIRQFYQLDYQFIDKEIMFRVIGEDANEFVKLSPEVVRRDFDFIPAGIFTMENKAHKAVKLMQFKQMTKDDPSVRGHVINKKIYQMLELGDDPKELMRDDGEMMEIMKLSQMLALKIIKDRDIKTSNNVSGNGSESTQFKEGSVDGSSQMPPVTPPGSGNPEFMP